MDGVIEKIDKLLALAGNNPSEEEAMAAMTKARELMMKYNVDESELQQQKKGKIGERSSNTRIKAEWKLEVGRIIAGYFRCRIFFYNFRGIKRVAFFGYEIDCDAALNVFEFSLNYIEKGAAKYSREHGTISRDDYIFGFLVGMDTAFETQTKKWAEESETKSMVLAASVPKEVMDLYEVFSQGFKTINSSNKIMGGVDVEARIAGFRAGKDYGRGFGNAIESRA